VRVEREIRGPDGAHDWVTVRCAYGGADACKQKAGEECPHGYRTAPGGTPTVLTIKCGRESEEASSDDQASDSSDDEGAPKAKQKSICVRAYEHIDDLIAAWAERSPGREGATEPPARATFVSMCGGLSEDVQRCLTVPYGKNHDDECGPLFEALPAKKRTRIDELLLAPAQ